MVIQEGTLGYCPVITWALAYVANDHLAGTGRRCGLGIDALISELDAVVSGLSCDLGMDALVNQLSF